MSTASRLYRLNFRLATSQAGLASGNLFLWHIPAPDVPTYKDHAAKTNLANGGQALRGFRSVTWLWNRLPAMAAYTVRRLVTDALEDTGLLYLTIDLGWNGSRPPGTWVDARGVPHIPDIAPASPGAQVVDNLVLFVNDVEIVSDPAMGL